ncbi:AGAP002314-PA [Anopheles gambiae str. PEST]|uniref:AGAP002314-PA n=1 Tax=Anopheles gambiae TaxID=7165 RepID=Q5TTP2_ANOGA|nr:AGAP002314-PA [Anopheles gambiae str. PEST]
MTRIGKADSVKSETSSLPDDRTMDYAVDNPAEANSDWTDEVIVKSEVILPAEQLSPSKRCRLCDSADHIWVPCFSLGGGVELTPSHLETITLISDIVIRYETDFSSVVCSYCLLKIEEFTVLRDVWKSKDKERHNWDEPSTKPKLPEISIKAAAMTDASTQTDSSDQLIAVSSAEVPESVAGSKKEGPESAKEKESTPSCAAAHGSPSTSCKEHESPFVRATEQEPTLPSASEQELPPDAATEQESTMASSTEQEVEPALEAQATQAAPVSAYEQDTIIIDDADDSEEVIDVERYYASRSKRRRTRSPTKDELIRETLRLVKQQYRRKRHQKIR